MKKTGLFLLLLLAVSAYAQQADSTPMATADDQAAPQGTLATSVTFPMERVQTPTNADLYCAGFVTKQLEPNANFVAGGLNTPNTTKFANGDVIYLAGTGYQAGQQYSLLRELTNPSKYELYPGQDKMLKSFGQPYAEMGRVRIVDVRSKMAIAQIEFSCDPVNPGDIAVPFVEKTAIGFHPPQHFDRFEPASSKLSGRIVLAKDFDSTMGTGAKVYLNVGSTQGVKTGDYFRAVRPYASDLSDPADSLSFKASAAEDTQKRPPTIEPNFLTRTKGAAIHVADMPRRAVGEIVILTTTDTTATGMVVFALEDIHVGDHVELDQQ
jgi:hypothetical protein